MLGDIEEIEHSWELKPYAFYFDLLIFAEVLLPRDRISFGQQL